MPRVGPLLGLVAFYSKVKKKFLGVLFYDPVLPTYPLCSSMVSVSPLKTSLSLWLVCRHQWVQYLLIKNQNETAKKSSEKVRNLKMFGNGVKTFDCVDLHCEGEPARILTSGFPVVPGKWMSQKREFIKNNLQHIPKLLLQVVLWFLH